MLGMGLMTIGFGAFQGNLVGFDSCLRSIFFTHTTRVKLETGAGLEFLRNSDVIWPLAVSGGYTTYSFVNAEKMTISDQLCSLMSGWSSFLRLFVC